MWQFTHCPNDLSPAIINAKMSRLRVLKVYSADGVLNQRTLQVPVNGLTLSVHTLREMLGEVQEMSIINGGEQLVVEVVENLELVGGLCQCLVLVPPLANGGAWVIPAV